MCESVVGATLELYSHVLAALPATPSRFHYLFNPRDLGRVLEGLLLSTPERCATPGALARLWRNECLRIFHDRMISEEDKQARPLFHAAQPLIITLLKLSRRCSALLMWSVNDLSICNIRNRRFRP